MAARDYAPMIVRLSVGIVFLLLGVDQVIHTDVWTGYLPEWFINLLPAWQTPESFMYANGVFDSIIGLLLLLGVFTRLIAVLATVHLTGVVIALGYNEIAIRDIGILLSALAVAFFGSDRWCLERQWQRRIVKDVNN